MAQTKVRVPGGGNTFMTVKVGNNDKKIAFLANVNDTPGRSVGNPTAIHPIGNAYPVEIATPFAQGMGTLVLTVWSTWEEDGWVSAFKFSDNSLWKNAGYTSKHNHRHNRSNEPVDLREVFEAQRGMGGYIEVKKWERDGKGALARVKTYKNCVIVDIDASDNVSIETMEQRVRITMNYAWMELDGTQGSSFSFYDDLR